MEEAFLVLGASIAYWSGDARLLPGDIRAAQPTVFCSVPRIFERFESTIRDKVGAGAAASPTHHSLPAEAYG